MTTLPHPEKSSMCWPENCDTGHPMSSVNLHMCERRIATGISGKCVIIAPTQSWFLHLTRSTERIRALRQERYQAKFRQKEKKTPTNPNTDDAESPSVRSRQCHWATVLREAKQQWSKNMIQEQACLLVAYHHVGSMQVLCWVKEEVYTHMEQYAWHQIMLMLALTWIMTRVYQRSGFWAPERGICWEIDSTTEASNESDKSTDCSSSDEPEDW